MRAKKYLMGFVGVPNCGKTTLFNKIAKVRQKVANYAGVTITSKEKTISANNSVVALVDLPGIYTLNAYAQDEYATEKFIMERNPDSIFNVVNAGALHRSLYLTVQLLEKGVSVFLALTMMDEAEKKGIHIDIEKLQYCLGIPVQTMIGRTGKNVIQAFHRAVEHMEHTPKDRTPLRINYENLEPYITQIIAMLEESTQAKGNNIRWRAIKYLENNPAAMEVEKNNNTKNHEEICLKTQEIRLEIEKKYNTDVKSIMAIARNAVAKNIADMVIITKPKNEKWRKIDNVLTGKWTGFAIMGLVLYGVYEITFGLGQYPVDWLTVLLEQVQGMVGELLPEGIVRSLIVSGIIAGVFAVLSFVPVIFIAFLLLSMLEDLGYTARMSYMIDKIFKSFGLQGGSMMPFIIAGGIAGGCAVPAVLATRTLRDRKEKIATMITAPFMLCGAKFPVLMIIAAAFFSKNAALVMLLLTILSWAVTLVVSLVLRATVLRGEALPYIVELPPYRMPTVQSVFIGAWNYTKGYIKRAGTLILSISIIMWALMTFPMKENPIDARDALNYSIAGRATAMLEPIFKPLGFNWEMTIALLAALPAKEIAIATLSTAYSLQDEGNGEANERSLQQYIKQDKSWTIPSAIAMLIFFLLYTPCLSTVFTIARESGSRRWAVISVVIPLILAYILAWIGYTIAVALGL